MVNQRTAVVGFWSGIAAYVMWGVFPFYFHEVTHYTTPFEILAHRVVWSMPVLAALITFFGKWSAFFRVVSDRKALGVLTASAGLIAINWLLFIYAIATKQSLQASLGYFINPLLNVLLGVVFLNERLRRLQVVSLLLAACGALYLTAASNSFPWIAITLAVSFSLYGLLRKQASADAVVGLFVETLLLTPAGIGYIIYLTTSNTLTFDDTTHNMLLLSIGGPLTAAPLIFFAIAARRLPLSSLGMMQYLAPSLQFLIAVFAFQEVFTRAHAVAFTAIWTALIIFVADAYARTKTPAPAETPPS